jgi:hypothetical protein
MLATGKAKTRALQQIKEIKPQNFDVKKFQEVKLPGKGPGKTYTLNFLDAVELVKILPSKKPWETRKIIIDVITKYFADEPSIIPEDQANAQPLNPIHDCVGSKRAAEEQELAQIVKKMREDVDIIKSSLSDAKEHADVASRMLDIKKQSWAVDEKGRAKQIEDEAKKRAMEREDEAKKRADEIAYITAAARARVEAAAIERRAQELFAPAPVPAADPYPDVASFIPDDHTTVKAYYEGNPKFKAKGGNFLNKAMTQAEKMYKEAFKRAPLRVREGGKTVFMYPTVWLADVFSTAYREVYGGLGQTSISGWTIVHH